MFTNATDAKRYTLAGKAKVTLKSVKTGNHFTYQIKKAKFNGDIYFVSVLSGPDNENDYRYMGVLKPEGFFHTAKSKVGPDATSAKAFNFFCKSVINEQNIPEGLEVRHENHCGRCNRLLTTPESVDRGIGPECWKKVCV